jgi:hypothetical protein
MEKRRRGGGGTQETRNIRGEQSEAHTQNRGALISLPFVIFCDFPFPLSCRPRLTAIDLRKSEELQPHTATAKNQLTEKSCSFKRRNNEGGKGRWNTQNNECVNELQVGGRKLRQGNDILHS